MSGRWTYTPLGDVANKQEGRRRQFTGGSLLSGIVGAQAFKVFDWMSLLPVSTKTVASKADSIP